MPTSETAAVGVLAAVLAAIASAVVLFRRSQGLERRQLKVFLFGVATVAGWVALVGITETLVGQGNVPTVVEGIGNLVLWSALPVSTGVAIVRHGLYDIDRVISRTMSYSLVLISLVSLFAGVVVGLPELFGLDSNLAVASAT